MYETISPPLLSQLINPLQGKADRPPQWLEFTRIEERIIIKNET
jgi:hypothetical protein